MSTINLRTDTDYSARRKRRDAVKDILMRLSAIRDAEQAYLDRVPDSLQNSESFETGERAVDTFDDVIELLGDVY